MSERARIFFCLRYAHQIRLVMLAAVTWVFAAGLGACSGSTATSLVEPVSPLLFVSNRNRTGSQRPAAYFGDSIGDVSYGECLVDAAVEFEPDRADGFLDFFLPFRGAEIDSVTEFDDTEFMGRLSEYVAEDDAMRIVLFVHGYAYSFPRGCRRVSALQAYLGDHVRVVLFSWPSNGNPLAYGSDESDLERSVPALTTLIQDLQEQVGGDRISLVAHSMGTLGVMQALRNLDRQAGPGPVIRNLVLLAPDYDSDAFEADLAILRSRVDRVTAYISDKDALLKLSSAVNGEARLGQGIDSTALLAGVETIDVSDLRRYHPTGHEYYRYHPVVISDLVELIVKDRPAAGRGATVARKSGEFAFWRLRRESN